jgi:hypothetical protein
MINAFQKHVTFVDHMPSDMINRTRKWVQDRFIVFIHLLIRKTDLALINESQLQDSTGFDEEMDAPTFSKTALVCKLA